jgi:hypothetical protein
MVEISLNNGPSSERINGQKRQKNEKHPGDYVRIVDISFFLFANFSICVMEGRKRQACCWWKSNLPYRDATLLYGLQEMENGS